MFHPAKVVVTLTRLGLGAGIWPGPAEADEVADGALALGVTGGLALGSGVGVSLWEDVIFVGLAVAEALGSGEEHETTTTAATPATNSDGRAITVRRLPMCTGRPRGFRGRRGGFPGL